MLNKFYKWLDTPPIVRIMRAINGEPPPPPKKNKVTITHNPGSYMAARRRAVAEMEKKIASKPSAKPTANPRKGKR